MFLVDKINVRSCVMVRFFHVVEIVGTTCELVGTSRVCFNHVVRSRACACTNVQRDASRHCRHYYGIPGGTLRGEGKTARGELRGATSEGKTARGKLQGANCEGRPARATSEQRG